MLNITNTIPDFLTIYNSNNKITPDILETYYQSNSAIFDIYFPKHCKKNNQRINTAIEKYPQKIEDIKTISEILPDIIKDTYKKYSEFFSFDIPINFNLFVGGFGSNAFVDRKPISNIYFAVEKLTVNRKYLEVIVAHEIGHVYHRIFSNNFSINWDNINWESGEISLYQEGIATLLSKIIINDVEDYIYLSYDSTGSDDLKFYKNNKQNIKVKFKHDCADWDNLKSKEWFRLSGGSYFNITRLGYFLGIDFSEEYYRNHGLKDTLLLWGSKRCEQEIQDFLSE